MRGITTFGGVLQTLSLLMAACGGANQPAHRARDSSPKVQPRRLQATALRRPSRKRAGIIRIQGESGWARDPDEGPVSLAARHTWAPAGRYLALILGNRVPFPVGDEQEIRVERQALGWAVNGRFYALDLRQVGLAAPLPHLERKAVKRATCLVWAGDTKEFVAVAKIIASLPHRCVSLWLRAAPQANEAPGLIDLERKTTKPPPWQTALGSIGQKVVSLRLQSEELKVSWAKLGQLLILESATCQVPKPRELPRLEQLTYEQQSEWGQCAVTDDVVRLARRRALWRLEGLNSTTAKTHQRIARLRVEALVLKTEEWSFPGKQPGAPAKAKLPPLKLPVGLRELRLKQQAKPSWGWLQAAKGLRLLSTLRCAPMAGLAALPQLEWLHLNRCPVPTRLPRLRVLSLDVDNKHVYAALAGLAKATPGLRELILSHYGNVPSKTAPSPLTGLPPSLRYLKLQYLQLEPGVGASLKHLSGLQELRIASELPTTRFTAPWLQLRSLRRLDLSKAKLPATALAGLGQLRNLRFLRLDGTHGASPAWSELGKLRELRTLSLRRVQLNDTQAAQLGKLSKLKQLILAETPIGATRMSWLVHLGELTHLDLSGTLVTDSALRNLWGKLRHLVSLSLEGTDLTHAGLAGLKQCHNLRQLSLAHTGLTAGQLAKLPLPSHLYALRLAYTHLNGADLASVAPLRRLRTLDLRGAGLKDLDVARLPKLQGLLLLLLGQNQLSKQTLKKLRARLPNTGVSCLPCKADGWIFKK